MSPSSNPESRRRRRRRRHRRSRNRRRNRRHGWPNLSNDILLDILNRLHTLPDFSAFRSVCQSWRNIASLQNPNLSPLLALNGGHCGALYDIVACRFYFYRLDFKTIAFSHGHFISLFDPVPFLQSDKPCIELYDFFHRRRIELPDHPHPFRRILLSAHPADPSCRVVLFNDRRSSASVMQCIQYLIVGQLWWTSLTSPHLNFFYDMMCFQGELVALTGGMELLVLELVRGCLTLRRFGNHGVVGMDENCCNAWLAELDGAMVVILQVAVTTDNGGVIFRVLRWSVEEEEWEEIRDVGDRALFVSSEGSAVFVSAGRLSLRNNCVYSISDERARWVEFCLEDRSSVTVMINDRNWPGSNSSVWVFP